MKKLLFLYILNIVIEYLLSLPCNNFTFLERVTIHTLPTILLAIILNIDNITKHLK